MAGDAPASDADPLVGRILSERYRIERKLGEGGMGSVYLAEHVVIQKKVALKVLAPELARKEELAARFLQEARAASRIGQENVIDISDFGRSDGAVFFVMEYLEGMDLGAALRTSGALGWARTRRIVLQILRALRSAHALGIIHRDLKPENVFLIEREGRPDFVKLLDFGIAKMPGDPGEGGEGAQARLTRTGMIFGTPDYMAPEQAEGKVADHRADLYSAGCVLYHCLTGSPPFSAASFMALLTKHLLEPVEAPSRRRPDLGIPPELDALVARSLEKDRDNRWASADEFAAAVTRAPGPAREAVAPADTSDLIAGSGTIPGHIVVDRPGSGPALRLPSPPGRTAVLPVPSGQSAAVPTTQPPAARMSVKTLAFAGLALGIAAALGFVLLRRGNGRAPGDQAPVATPAPAPKTSPPPSVPAAPTAEPAPNGADETTASDPTSAPEATGAGVVAPAESSRPTARKRDPRRPAAPVATPPARPEERPAAAPAVPSELKPFPGQP
ncbi:MAG TPA: serine/threonine-protein kinase [Polyangia bacterium]